MDIGAERNEADEGIALRSGEATRRPVKQPPMQRLMVTHSRKVDQLAPNLVYRCHRGGLELRGIRGHGADDLHPLPRVEPCGNFSGGAINRINGLSLTTGGILLLFPLSFIPFSNTLPALSVLLLALGMLQRDGIFILAGYFTLLLTILYFGGLALLLFLSGKSLLF